MQDSAVIRSRGSSINTFLRPTAAFVNLLLPRSSRLRIGWLLVAALILASVMPVTVPLTVSGSFDDKIAHAVAYGILMAWFATVRSREAALVYLGYLLGMGMLIEALQFYLPWRSADLLDILANCVGLALAWCGELVLRRNLE